MGKEYCVLARIMSRKWSRRAHRASRLDRSSLRLGQDAVDSLTELPNALLDFPRLAHAQALVLRRALARLITAMKKLPSSLFLPGRQVADLSRDHKPEFPFPTTGIFRRPPRRSRRRKSFGARGSREWGVRLETGDSLAVLCFAGDAYPNSSIFTTPERSWRPSSRFTKEAIAQSVVRAI